MRAFRWFGEMKKHLNRGKKKKKSTAGCNDELCFEKRLKNKSLLAKAAVFFFFFFAFNVCMRELLSIVNESERQKGEGGRTKMSE